jgi:CheY-like chemotaxis protein
MEVIMTKIMLVEDDKSLREIYGVRLLAEGYEIISAGDGEEALATAVKEKPDLILSDVMMPKISGFDMLDILRSTPETKNIKVIMMTALSSEDQRSRGETLGADRYLVKSQVGIEDVVRTVHDVLGDIPVSAAPAAQKFGNPVPTEVVEQPATPPEPPTPPTPAEQTPQPAAAPVAPPPTTPAPPEPPVAVEPTPITAEPEPVTTPEPPVVAQPTPVSEPQPPITPAPVEPVAPQPPTTPPPVAPSPTEPTPTPAPAAPASAQPPKTSIPVTSAPTTPAPTTEPAAPAPHLPEPTAPFSTAAPASLGERVINPPEPAEKPKQDIQSLMSQELQLDDGSNTQPLPPPTS